MASMSRGFGPRFQHDTIHTNIVHTNMHSDITTTA
jgi:hypothetical protein